MMKHVEGWRQSFDGVKLYTQYWEPDGSPKGVVCLVHGIGEHGGRYGHVGEAFAEAGYVLWSYDARGHGQSEGARGYIPNYLAFMRDINSSVVAAKEKYPQVPTFMYGHRMGG
ncbi:MAG TPA: alpha/beta fold hydrolase, partial [Anaerolineae bacterium]|nr:alpha/beta fold hydrolase [Anaerolineae bacterium]